MERASWDVTAMSEVQRKVENDHNVKEETGGTDSTDQQRCQLILRQLGTEREQSTHPPAPGCRMDATETKSELNTAGREGGHY